METEAGMSHVGRPRLPTERIVETALQLIDEQGADALSMRSVAQRLNSSTATLYRHFPNRAALVVAVIDRVLGEIDAGVDQSRPGDWPQVLRRIATDYFAALNRHPGVARLLADHTPVGPRAIALWETWLSAMLRNGFSLGTATRAAGLIASYVQGFGIQLGGQRVRSGPDGRVLAVTAAGVDPAAHPSVTAALRARIGPISLHDAFTFGLDLILDGLRDALEGRR